MYYLSIIAIHCNCIQDMFKYNKPIFMYTTVFNVILCIIFVSPPPKKKEEK